MVHFPFRLGYASMVHFLLIIGSDTSVHVSPMIDIVYPSSVINLIGQGFFNPLIENIGILL